MKHLSIHFSLRPWLPLGALLIATSLAAQAQSVGVGTATPDAKAVLDISANDKGLLIPRLDSAQRAAIAAPPDGLMVFQRNGRVGLWYAFGGTWFYIPDKVKAGDNLGDHTARQPLNLGTNPLVGSGASIAGQGIGVRADGGLNVGQNTSGNNVLIGYRAGAANTTGAQLHAMGYQAGAANTTGVWNHFDGYRAGESTTTGSYNTYIGFNAGSTATSASENMFVGHRAGQNATGDANHAVGHNAGIGLTTGTQNTFNGYGAGSQTSTGNNNTFFGLLSGNENITGSNNWAFGHGAGPATGSSALTNAGAIGYLARVSQSNSLVLGGIGANAVNVGIGTTAPANRLDVRGVGSSTVANFQSPSGWGQIYVSNSTATSELGADNAGGYGGTTSAHDFRLRTGATTRLFIQQTTGNVGIGTSTPAQRLDVGGNATISGNVGVGVSAPAARLHVGGNMLAELTSGTFTLNNFGGTGTTLLGTFTGNSLGPQLRFTGVSTSYMDIGQDANGNFVVEGNDAARLTVLNGGNVGVGTTAPTQALDVNGGILARSNSAVSNQGAYLHWNRSGAEGETWLLNQRGAGGANAGIRFGAVTTANSVTEWARFLDNGNFGIGTTAPAQRLDVNGGILVRSNSTVTTQGAYLHWNRSGAEGETWLLNQRGAGGANAGIRFGAVTTANAVTEWARFLDNGNFGIGTTAPTQRLDVNGNGTLSGSLGVGTSTLAARLHINGNMLAELTAGTFTLNNFGAGGGTALLGTFTGATGTGPQLRFTGVTTDFMDIGQNAAGNFVVEGNDNARLTVLNTGNVGVGISTPGERFQVDGGNLKIGNDAWGNTANDRLLYIGDADYVSIGETGADDVLTLRAKTFSFLPSPTGGYSGNVGIGAGTPTSPLTVNGAVAVPYTTATTSTFALTSAHQTVRRFGTCAAITIPQPGTCPGRLYTIINSNGTGSNVALTTSGVIYDDVTNTTITSLAPNNRITIQSDGTNWIVVGR